MLCCSFGAGFGGRGCPKLFPEHLLVGLAAWCTPNTARRGNLHFSDSNNDVRADVLLVVLAGCMAPKGSDPGLWCWTSPGVLCAGVEVFASLC